MFPVGLDGPGFSFAKGIGVVGELEVLIFHSSAMNPFSFTSTSNKKQRLVCGRHIGFSVLPNCSGRD